MVSVDWLEGNRTLLTRVAGVLTLQDVHAWTDQLHQASRRIPGESAFKMLIDIRDYEVDDQDREVHRAMREVTPLFLAAHGLDVGFFKLYDEEPPLRRAEGSALCVAVAHVHHDAAKMERYNELLSTPYERFFSVPEEAAAWLAEAAQEPA